MAKVKFIELKTANIFPALTGLRYVAALLVFVHHFTPLSLPVFVYDVLQEWHVGVTIFFVLSGFLICHRYYHLFASEKNWFKKYMVNRIARIYPVYFIITTVAFLFYNEGLKIYLLNITFLRGFFEQYFQTGIAQGWSLTVEEVFYVCAPVIFLLHRKINLWMMPLAILTIGILLTVYFNDIKTADGFFGSYRFTLLYTFFGRCFEFFAGIQLALWLKENGKTKKTIFSFTYLGALSVLLITIVLSLLRVDEKYGLHTGWGIALNNFVLPVFIVMLIYGLITESTAVEKMLSTKLFQLLGKSSYCFYLIHLGILHTVFVKYIGNYFFIELFTSTIISVLLFKCIEEPLNKKVKVLFGV